MSKKETDIKVGGRLWSTTTDGYVIDASQIENLAEGGIAEVSKVNDQITSLNIEGGEGKKSVQQVKNIDSFSFNDKNTNASQAFSDLKENLPEDDSRKDAVIKIGENTLDTSIKVGAIGDSSTSFGGNSSAYGKGSLSQGETTITIGSYSHTEGKDSVTLGNYSHAEGHATTSVGVSSHAEGFKTQALGARSHAEGEETIAVGKASHSSGLKTVANQNYQTVIGTYNDNKVDTLFEVGKGSTEDVLNEAGEVTTKNRSNAFEVLRDGRAKVFGVPTDSDDVVRLKELKEALVGKTDYLGTASALTDLTTDCGKGDFYRVAVQFNFDTEKAHVGDILLATKDNPRQNTSDWDLIHTEVDSNTWTANTKGAAGYVAQGESNPNKVWKTDSEGNPAWRDDNDSKVTSVENHYTPTANENSSIIIEADSTTKAMWNSTSLVTGVEVMRDAAGHVTDISLNSVQMPINPSHTHINGVGLTRTGDGNPGDTVEYKANLLSENPLTINAVAATETSGRVYPVSVDKSGYLAVNVPWTDTNTQDGNDNQTIKGNGVAFGANDAVNIIGGENVTITPNTIDKTITISALDTNTHNSHSIISGGDSKGNLIQGEASSGTIILGDSGVTGGSYGPSTDTTPAHAGTFSVPEISVNNKGVVIGASTKNVKLPAETAITITNKSDTDSNDLVYVVNNLTENGEANHSITPTYIGLPTKAYVDKVATGHVKYLGTITSIPSGTKIATDEVGQGDFYRIQSEFDFGESKAHVGDILLAKTDSPSESITDWDLIHTDCDTNTWVANTKTAAGYVAEGNGNVNKVWGTDDGGNPSWRDPTDYINVENGTGPKSIKQIDRGEDKGNTFTFYRDNVCSNPNADEYEQETYKGAHFKNETINGKAGQIVHDAVGTHSSVFGGISRAIGDRSQATGSTTIAVGPVSHTEGTSTVAFGANSHTEGYVTTTIGDASHAEGAGTIARGEASHAEGAYTIAEKAYSHAEGESTHAEGVRSHTEGYDTHAIGENSHAEGIRSIAEGMHSHAEGEQTHANGFASHAEGGSTYAIGSYSHTSGYGTIAKQGHQTIVGVYNDNKSNSLFEVGNGTAEDVKDEEGNIVTKNRSNAFEVLRDGRAKVYKAPEAAEDIVRKNELDETNREIEEIVADIEGRITEVTFTNIPDNTNINFIGLPGATKIDWGDGDVNDLTSHTYLKAGTYVCKIYDLTKIAFSQYGPPEDWMAGIEYITSLKIGNTVTSISAGGMYQCRSLNYVEMPNSVTEIGYSAFSDCSSLTRVVIGDSVTTIGNHVFSGCNNLTSVVIPDSVTSISPSMFSGCNNLPSVVIPDSVTSIDSSAFSGCSSLKSVVIPDSVTSIGNSAFSGCSGLISIKFKSIAPIGINGNSFSNTSNLKSIIVPKGTLSKYQNSWKAFLSEDILKLMVEDDFNREVYYSDLESYKVNQNIENGTGPKSIKQIDRGGEKGNTFTFYNKQTGVCNNPVADKYEKEIYGGSHFKNEIINGVPGQIVHDAIGEHSSVFGGISRAIGTRSQATGSTTIAVGAVSHTEGTSTVAFGANSHAEGFTTTAIGDASHSEGANAVARGAITHAEGYDTEAIGEAAHSQGYQTKAIGPYSHTEGFKTEARKDTAHAEGSESIASGAHSHAEGQNTLAEGFASHSQGGSTKAIGPYSFSTGYKTIAGYGHQTVIGTYNDNKSDTLFEVGNSHSEDVLNIDGKVLTKNRSNAFEVKSAGGFNSYGDSSVNGKLTVNDFAVGKSNLHMFFNDFTFKFPNDGKIYQGKKLTYNRDNSPNFWSHLNNLSLSDPLCIQVFEVGDTAPLLKVFKNGSWREDTCYPAKVEATSISSANAPIDKYCTLQGPNVVYISDDKKKIKFFVKSGYQSGNKAKIWLSATNQLYQITVTATKDEIYDRYHISKVEVLVYGVPSFNATIDTSTFTLNEGTLNSSTGNITYQRYKLIQENLSEEEVKKLISRDEDGYCTLNIESISDSQDECIPLLFNL